MPDERGPLISFAVPTYQDGHALPQALDSIFAQPGGDAVEVVVSNNASTDDTAAILTRYAAVHPNLRVLTQAVTVTFDENLARAIEGCSGDYVWTMSSDDVLEAGALPRVRAALAPLAGPVVVLGNWWIGDGELCRVRLRRRLAFDRVEHDRAQALVEAGVWGLFMSALVLPAARTRAELARYREGDGLTHWKVATRLLAAGVPLLSIGAPIVVQRWPDADAPPYYDVPLIFGEQVRRQMSALRRDFGVSSSTVRATESAVLRSILRGFVGTARRRWPEVAHRWFVPLLREYWSYPAFWQWIVPLYAMPRGVLGRLWPLVRGVRDAIAARA